MSHLEFSSRDIYGGLVYEQTEPESEDEYSDEYSSVEYDDDV